jgi:hypothetical protein
MQQNQTRWMIMGDFERPREVTGGGGGLNGS